MTTNTMTATMTVMEASSNRPRLAGTPKEASQGSPKSGVRYLSETTGVAVDAPTEWWWPEERSE